MIKTSKMVGGRGATEEEAILCVERELTNLGYNPKRVEIETLADDPRNQSSMPWFAMANIPPKKNLILINAIFAGLINSIGEPDEIIHNNTGIYLKRWFIVREYGKYNVYLHNFFGNDDDRALHDHPWPSVSVILSGSYNEVLEDGIHKREAGDVIFRDASVAHRIELIQYCPAWTLFITGEKCREWGFLCDEGWKHWQDFEKDGGCE